MQFPHARIKRAYHWEKHSQGKKLAQDWVESSRPRTLKMLHMNLFFGFAAQSDHATAVPVFSAQPHKLYPLELNTRGQVLDNNIKIKALVEIYIYLKYTTPKTSPALDMLPQLNAPKPARQLSQATLNFDGLQLDVSFARWLGMLKQLSFISPQDNALANAPLANKVPNPPPPQINATAVPSPFLNH